MKKILSSLLISGTILMASTTAHAATDYTVKSGDTLTSIAKKNNTTVTALKKENNLKTDTIKLGQKLAIPADPTIKKHTVQKGDTLNKIAKSYNVAVKDIKTWNNLKTDTIKLGQELTIKTKKAETTTNKENNSSTSTNKESSTVTTSNTHTVVKGEGLYSIAKKYGVTVDNIKTWNNLKSDTINIGQKLIIKNTTTNKETANNTTATAKKHTVAKGEGLYSIAKKYGVTVDNIKTWNNLKSDTINIGQKLVVEGKTNNTTVNTNRKVEFKPSTLKRIQHQTIKGIYISGSLMTNEQKYKENIALIDRTELNSVVIDVKLDNGDLLYKSEVPEAKKYGVGKNYAKNLDGTMKTLKDKNIYSIARIVTFKDKQLAGANPAWAIKNKNGTLYNDNGQNWINPYNQTYWKYVVNVAKEAASKGFDEIQFDYVRFPTNGAYMDKTVNWGDTKGMTKAQNIRAFLEYANKELKPYNVKISADIFGIATSASNDSGIGHDWSTLTGAVDVMSPMMYPSHYGAGVYGIANPNKDPYNTIKKGLQAAQAKDAKTKAKGGKVSQIRPWFQDFTQYGVKYGAKEVQAQLRAAKELGVNDYLLWNASNVYTESALSKEAPGK